LSVVQRARERGITEILHYTTQKGVQGSVMKWATLPTQRLANEEELAFIYQGVWPRRDPKWIDHVSLSISRINASLYDKSRVRYPDFWWGILSFTPEILDHEGVWFATTNNVYDEVCERGQGTDGFDALFKASVPWGYYGAVIHRPAARPDNWTTDRQAEVLYPGELSLDFLRQIYVPGTQHRALVHAWCEVFGRPEIDVEVDAAIFS
jgi:hypothetical protein